MRTLLAVMLFSASAAALAQAPGDRGCYVHVFAHEQFKPPRVTYSGPMHKPIDLSRARSVIVGPGARVVGYSGRSRRESLDLAPGRRIADTARLGPQRDGDSFQILCGGGMRAVSEREPDEEARPVPALFRRLDRNGDGYLSPRELQSAAARSSNWAALDKDGDRRIAPDEFSAVPAT